MRCALTIITLLTLVTSQCALADEPDRSTPEATAKSLIAAYAEKDLLAAATCVTPDSDELLAANLVGELLTIRQKLKNGPPQYQRIAERITDFLARQGIGKEEWVSIAVMASDRPQTSSLLLCGVAVQHIEHKPLFNAVAIQFLLTLSEQLPKFSVRFKESNEWEGVEIASVTVEGDDAQVGVTSVETDQDFTHSFRKVGDHWLLDRPVPLPSEIDQIVHPSGEILQASATSEITVDRSSTATPEDVHRLACQAWMNEDYRAMAECFTADSLEANAAIMLLQAQNSMTKDDLSENCRGQLEQAYHTAGIDQDTFGSILLASVKDAIEGGGDAGAARAAVAGNWSKVISDIRHKPRFCAAVQCALRPFEHGQYLYELHHIRHTIRQLGTRVDNIRIDDTTATATVHLPKGASRELQFVQTDVGWRISLPVPVPNPDTASAVLD